MQVERTNSNDLLIDKLPDGSKVIVDAQSETVFALNATAGAAWDACNRPTTLSQVTEDMQRSLDPRITEELALEAILQLQDRKLVTTSGSSSAATRRAMLTTLGGIALPLVACLTLAEQRAHAQCAASGCATTPPPVAMPEPNWSVPALVGLGGLAGLAGRALMKPKSAATSSDDPDRGV
jgi:hypothetical protein